MEAWAELLVTAGMFVVLEPREKGTGGIGRQTSSRTRGVVETAGLLAVLPVSPSFQIKYVCELYATSGPGNLVSLQGCWAPLQTDMLRSPGGCRNRDVGTTVATSHWKLQEVVGRAFHCHRLESYTKFSQVSKS